MMRIVLFILSFGLFISCDLIGNRVEIKFDQETFNNQRQLWQASEVKNYTYRLRSPGFFNYDGKILVKDGEFNDHIPTESSDGINAFMNHASIDEIYRTIDLFFSSNNNKNRKPDDVYLSEISVTYDIVNHIPIEIHYINYIPQGVHITAINDFYISDFVNTD